MSTPFQGKSLGGHSSAAVPAQQAGVAPSWSNQSQSTNIAAGGQDWVDDPTCAANMKETGWRCEAPRRKDSLYCFGHRNYSPVSE